MNKDKYCVSQDGEIKQCLTKPKCNAQHITLISKARIESGKPKNEQEYKIWENQQKRSGKAVPISPNQLNDILVKIKPYKTWHSGILKLKKEHPEIGYGSLKFSNKSARFQMINFLAHHPMFYFNRTDLEKVQKTIAAQLKLETLSTDIIQAVNKADQHGLAWDRLNLYTGYYYAITNIRFTGKRLPNRILLKDEKSIQQAEIQARAYLNDLATGKFEIGHKDPRLPLVEENIVLQPSEINRSHKDRYIFDDHGFPKVPNPEKFAINPSSFYENKKDRKIIYEALKKEFDEK